MRNSLADHWPIFFPWSVTVDWVLNKVDVFNFWKLRHFTNFIPGSDSIVGGIECVKLDAWLKTLKLFNTVVADPELFECLTDLIKTNDSLDAVSSKRQDFQLF